MIFLLYRAYQKTENIHGFHAYYSGMKWYSYALYGPLERIAPTLSHSIPIAVPFWPRFSPIHF